ncbi:MAG TPA: winged helix-turn-helix domain-containing protein [Candidatus Polarisedimenticolia bacterium]|nr:winged helix-turn-helix domain-containing protein [Candidatus Polarisedimenticolia bacterium]
MSVKQIYRFGPFEFDAESGELRRHGFRIPLEPQPTKVLGLLLARSGHPVTREELRQHVWGSGTFVDFERGLAYCIAQVRSALGDAANSPRYVETLPRRGFRFVAPVVLDAGAGPTSGEAASRPVAAPGSRRSLLMAVVILLVGLTGYGIILWRARSHSPMVDPTIRLAVAAFDNETGMASLDPVSRGLSDAVVARLAGLQPSRLGVIGNAAILQRARSFRDVKEIGRALRADYVVLGQLQNLGPRTVVLVHLIRAEDEVHLWANRFERDAPDWFSLQTEIAEAVATAVSRSVLHSAPASASASPQTGS